MKGRIQTGCRRSVFDGIRLISTELAWWRAGWGMKCRLVALGLIFLAAGLCCPRAEAALEDEVRAYEIQDAASPPPKDAILFVGSSSIKGWSNLAASFPNHTVLNRGFGGSQMSDLLEFFGRLVVPYDPPLIVVYEGDNDLAGSKTAQQVFAEYQDFAARVEQRLPDAEIAFIAVKPSPSRVGVMGKMADFNEMLRAFCVQNPRFRFVDVFTPMLNTAGQPRPELFQGDMLHMNAAGYAIWTSLIGPVLQEAPFQPVVNVLIDFGSDGAIVTEADDKANKWNNITQAVGSVLGGRLDALLDTKGQVTALNLEMLAPFAGVNQNGAATSPLYPSQAVSDSLFGNTEEFDGKSNVFPKFQISGLKQDAAYQFTFFASRSGVSDNRETLYTVEGGSLQTDVLDAANNSARVAQVEAMTPGENGSVTISLSPGPGNNNGNHFTYLGAMKIVEMPPPPPVTITQDLADVTVEAFQPAVFSLAAGGKPPFQVQWFRNGELLEGAEGFECIIPEAALALNGSRYSAKVSNATSEAMSREAVLTVVPDATPPALAGASSSDGVVVEVVFSEKLDPESAADPSRFQVRGGLVAAIQAALGADGKTVVLTLEHRVAGENTLGVSGVRDLSGNAIAAGASVSFMAPRRAARTYLFDFGSAGRATAAGGAPDNDPSRVWNNVAGIGQSNTGRLDKVKAVDGYESALSLVMIDRFNGANESGTLDSTLFPANATRDSLFGNTETFSGLSNIYPKFQLVGLEAGRRYDFLFYASRLGVNDNRETLYTLEGAHEGTVILNASNNINTAAVLSGMIPSTEGAVTISLTPAPANNNANHFTYLGVLQVTESAPLDLLPPQFLSTGAAALDWTGHGRLEWSPDLEADSWRPVEPSPEPPYFEPSREIERRFYRLMPRE